MISLASSTRRLRSVSSMRRMNCQPQILKAKPEDKFQLMRMGYFCADRRDFSPEHVVLNQIVGLKDTFAKVVKK